MIQYSKLFVIILFLKCFKTLNAQSRPQIYQPSSYKKANDVEIIIENSIRMLNISMPLLNNIPKSESEEIIEKYQIGKSNEDTHLNITQLIKKYGYAVEKHEVLSSDGYLLTMFRIPGNGSLVFLMHGLLCSADDWIISGPESGLAYLLANEGYDVWMGNARGNKHSRKHAYLSPNNPKFWNFSWDEIGRYDLPVMIDYTLNHSGQNQVIYVGHSQGTTAFFVLCSERPEYNDKISIMVALSAVAWMSHVVSPILRLVSPFNPLLYSVAKLFGIYEFLPRNNILNALLNTFCGQEELAEIICNNIMYLLCGFDYKQANVTNLPVIYSHTPAGASTKQLVHYGQEIVSGKFCKFDHGFVKNMEVYGSKTPPEYSVDKITVPIVVFHSDGDWLAHPTDLEILSKKLRNRAFYKVKFKDFNHIDFLWAKNVKELVNNKVMEILYRSKYFKAI